VVSPYSNPRALPAHPELNVVDYLIKVVESAIFPEKKGGLKDPAISFHLGKGGRIVRIIENAFPKISWSGQPPDIHPYQLAIGGGYSVVLEYDLDEIAQEKSKDQISRNLIDSLHFLLKLKEERQQRESAAQLVAAA
jgi:hypothetical protein